MPGRERPRRVCVRVGVGYKLVRVVAMGSGDSAMRLHMGAAPGLVQRPRSLGGMAGRAPAVRSARQEPQTGS